MSMCSSLAVLTDWSSVLFRESAPGDCHITTGINIDNVGSIAVLDTGREC